MGNEKRVKYDHSNPRLPVFTERFRSLTEDRGGVTEMARVTGFSRPTVQFWYNGERTPDAGNLITLSRTLGVSVDYLLGLSDVSSRDPELQAVAKYTGLSEAAIEATKRANNRVWWCHVLRDESDFYPASLPYGIGERLNDFLPLLVDKVLPILGKIEYLVYRGSYYSKARGFALGDMHRHIEEMKEGVDKSRFMRELRDPEIQRGEDVYKRLRYAALDLSEVIKDCADEVYHYRAALADLDALLREAKTTQPIVFNFEDDIDEGNDVE